MEERVGELEAEGRALEARPAPPADDVRPRDDARARLLLRRRELLAPPVAARGRLAAVDAARLLPAGLAARRRRVAHDDPAGRRHVQERPDAQGDPRRLRVPAAVGARQPAADLRGVRGDRQPGGLHVARRPGRTSSSAAQRIVEQLIRPTGIVDPPITVRPTEGQIDDLLEEIRRPRRARRAGPGHDADQEDGRGPDRLPARSSGSRSSTSTARSTRSSGSRSCATCASACSTSSSASTCCARASTCPR